jgi:hypothetical protein
VRQNITQTYVENNFLRPDFLLNGGFNSWQRGTSLSDSELTTFSNYCADQWRLTFPPSQQLTVSKATDTFTTNFRSHSCLSLTLSNATVSLSTNTQFGLFQPIEGIYARNLLYSPLTFAGKIQTNRGGKYSAFISWVDTASSNYYYYAVPITLIGNNSEETFVVNFDPCPTTFTPQKGEALSMKVGIILAGNALTTSGVYLNCPAASETYCVSGQENFFASSSNTFKISQVTLNLGRTPKNYILDSATSELESLYRYIERVRLSSHLVNLYSNTTSHTGMLNYTRKLSSTPSFNFLQTDESKSSITNSSAVYYVGGNTAFTLGSFAAAARTTNTSTKFNFTTTTATPVGVDTGNINLDVLVSSNLV